MADRLFTRLGWLLVAFACLWFGANAAISL
jgi:hypothetical protein